ncbi:MAG: HD domain-containing phosphohydrolase [Pseudomonadota bacterium]
MKILLAEDEPVSRLLLQHYLQEWGHQVSLAENGRQALERFLAGKQDMVITDWAMPEMDGVELARHIRSLGTEGWPYVYIIMLTGRSSHQDVAQGLIQGAVDDYVIKPFDPGELRARLQVGERTVRLERTLSDYSRGLEAKVRQQTRQIRRSQEETIIRLLAALEHRDVETGDHVRRIGLYSARLAESLGWSPEDVDNIQLAAPMHDIGKIGVPDAVLRKPGALTSEEFEIIKTHCQVGRDILAGSRFAMLQMAEAIAHGHHERWGGGGYPRGLAGEDIPEAARIVALVDAFDAMSCDRVYRPAMSMEQVLEIMQRGRGGHFEPRLYDKFMELLPELRDILSSNV